MRRKWAALLLAAVPGLGHLYVGRQWRGLLFFGIFALAVNGYFTGVQMTRSPTRAVRQVGQHVRLFCAIGAAAIWLYSVLDVARLSKQFETKPLRERKDYHFKRGLHHYLAGAFESACGEFLTVLKLDPMDVDARFHLGMTHRALGQNRRAARAFKRCLADDPDGKWKWEAEAQLKQVRGTK